MTIPASNVNNDSSTKYPWSFCCNYKR